MARKRNLSLHLEPDIPYRSGTIVARCKKAWLTLLEHLYANKITSSDTDIFLWETRFSGAVRLTPRSSNVIESSGRLLLPEVKFTVKGVQTEFRRAKKKSDRTALEAEFHRWIGEAIIESFLSSKVDIEYSYFNIDEGPFSVFATPHDRGTSKSELTLLISDFGGLTIKQLQDKQECLQGNREYKPRGKLSHKRRLSLQNRAKPKPKKNEKVIAFNKGWRRFYFDDGTTREFCYVKKQQKQLITCRGTFGQKAKQSTKNCESPQSAQKALEKACSDLLQKGFVEYANRELEYLRKSRRALKLIKRDLADFEKLHQLRIPSEFRKYILETNGGRPVQQQVTLPGHPKYKTVNVGDIHGFMTGQMVNNIDYHADSNRLPAGHVPVADELHLFTVDSLGAVHFWDTDRLERADTDDDNVTHYDRMESYLVAASFDEFLSRIATFPNDTQARIRVRSEASKKKAVLKQRESPITHAKHQPLRRFYYDDGATRKYWHIELKNKSHTTHYARLGGRPGSTTKTFSSKELATTSAEKLVRQKLGKGYAEVIPELLQIERPVGLRRATASAIDRFEKQIGEKLPDEYRRFLRERNGGRPTPWSIRIPGVPHIKCVDVEYIYGLYPRERNEGLLRAIEIVNPVLPRGHLPVASGSDIFTLSLRWNRGSIYFWDHESSLINENTERFLPAAGHLLAHSFDEFLARIAESDDE